MRRLFVGRRGGGLRAVPDCRFATSGLAIFTEHPATMTEAPLKPGDIEVELGVPLPGVILPPERWARTAIKRLPPPGPLDVESVFGRRAPLVLDLGCGNGRFLVTSALQRPDFDHLGIDALPVVIRYATRRANQRGLSNVRLAVCGAHEFLEHYLASGTVREIHIYHPQPYHRADQRERRLLTAEFLVLVYDRLTPDGKFFIQTDNPHYWEYLRQVLPTLFELVEQAGPWPDSPRGRTRREIQARAQGLAIYRGWGTPLTGRSTEELAALATRLPRPDFRTNREQSRPRRRRRR